MCWGYVIGKKLTKAGKLDFIRKIAKFYMFCAHFEKKKQFFAFSGLLGENEIILKCQFCFLVGHNFSTSGDPVSIKQTI